MTKQKIAVVGTGISGLGAAWMLHTDYDITVYEKNPRIGGHSNTVDVDYDGKHLSVDTGFIVYNDGNYPNLKALFQTLGVDIQHSPMSFGVSVDEGRFEWSSDAVFAQYSNAARPSFWSMLTDIMRFNRTALNELEAGNCHGLTLGEYLDMRGYGQRFRTHYLLAMGAAIWSTSVSDMMAFPAETLIRFFDNHRLLSARKQRWQTVAGGSRQYVNKLTAAFRDRINLNRGVRKISRYADGVLVTDETGVREKYDHVILACHSDEALSLLADPDEDERSILGAMRYAPNSVYLHRDERLMPRRKPVWSSWNVTNVSTEEGRKVSVSYWMNKLQNIDRSCPLFVSLNPDTPPREETIFGEFCYDHPQFDRAAIAAQKLLPGIQGARNTWFCGAYTRYGFHEDGLMSGLAVAEKISGIARPWAQPGTLAVKGAAARPAANVDGAVAEAAE